MIDQSSRGAGQADDPQTADVPQVKEPDAKSLRKVLVAAGLGHFVEWFDFGIYGTLAVILAHQFFPSGNPQAELLSTFAVFGAGFVMRPLGGMFFGSLGDRIGRQKTLAIVVLTTSAATLAMGLLPTHATAGVLAPALLVLCRLVQGFAAGGESAGATTLLAEYAPERRRGFVTSWIDASGFAAFVAGSGLVLLLSAALGDAMDDWGWRIPFLLAAPLGIAGFYLRSRLEDSPEFRKLKSEGGQSRSPLRESFTIARTAMLFCVGFMVIKAVGHWALQTFMPGYLQTTLEFSRVQAFAITTAGLFVVALAVPFMGALSDRVGRKPLLIAGSAGMAVLAWPAFWLLSVGNGLLAAVAMIALGLCLAAFDGAISAALAELFPTRVRYGAMAVSYNFAAAIFGGMTPYFATWLIGASGYALSPAFYLIVIAVVSGVTVLRARETAPARISD
ncbi:MFS transporter [Streptomyces sp. TRM66268-LWL]|uniref:MFS transporter n=1 Tax=Streptomyces polyasparticus TaxID=2767826 RepID=A0ABR7SLS5_9ACTN|nr:MFS transporter [Streptomyces polyasparticus]MBC9715859.1 MFS transporter [Streptomyces polyasparticus]